jgi:hypothetical protein
MAEGQPAPARLGGPSRSARAVPTASPASGVSGGPPAAARGDSQRRRAGDRGPGVAPSRRRLGLARSVSLPVSTLPLRLWLTPGPGGPAPGSGLQGPPVLASRAVCHWQCQRTVTLRTSLSVTCVASKLRGPASIALALSHHHDGPGPQCFLADSEQ